MTTTEPVFHEAWFGPDSCKALADLYHEVDHLTGDVVEVGSWEGRSTIALAAACAPSLVHAVDTWLGSPGEISADLAAERDVYAEFMANLRLAGAANVVPFRMGWRDYFARFRQPVRFLFIDATHSYEEVRDNVAAALPLMVPGGIMCGDDQHHPPVRRAVVEVFPEAKAIATLWVHKCP